MLNIQNNGTKKLFKRENRVPDLIGYFVLLKDTSSAN